MDRDRPIPSHDIRRTANASYIQSIRDYPGANGHDGSMLTTDICRCRSRKRRRQGSFPDLEAEYHDARLAIAPLTSGTRGMPVYVAEAIGFGGPLVTKTLGLDPADTGWVSSAALIADMPGNLPMPSSGCGPTRALRAFALRSRGDVPR